MYIIRKRGLMEKIIIYETLRKFAYSNDHLIEEEIKGIVIEFYGLGGMTMHQNDLGDGLEYAKDGIIYLIPYYNPWSWMNKQAIDFTDELVEVLCNHYNIKNPKIISTGKSMGGLSSLVYTRYSKVTPIACVANCPVCDLPYHYTEREDLPRTLYSAFGSYDMSLEDALKLYSPYHLVDEMPNIEYTIFHCENDKAVNIDKHSIKFIEKMKINHNIKLIKVPLRGHCDLSPMFLLEYKNTILNYLK